MNFVNPLHLVETDWLAPQLDDPSLRVLECTVFRQPGALHGYRVESGRSTWATGHIPGSGFADLTADLCDQTSPFLLMLPPPPQFADAMSRLGVSDGVRVVLYDRDMNVWAARVWWMLRAFGFDDAVVLNGGWCKWTLERRAVSTDPDTSAPRRFTARPRPELFTDKSGVLAGLGDRSTCVLNALTEEQHRGSGGATYGRPGRIAGSVNVPARALVDPKTHAYLDPATLRAKFAAAGALDAGRVITYCGGGVAASSDALILTLLGHEHVAVYDASLSEWAADPVLPMDTG